MPHAQIAQQLSFLDTPGTPAIAKIVNVASVPQRSPFRYPGGKTWLIPYMRHWLARLPTRPAVFIEPFAGGASIGLMAAFENAADQVILAELDSEVAVVWQVILSDQAAELAERIIAFDLSADSVQNALVEPGQSAVERAFQTILKNRVNRGGVLAPGAGRIKNGEDGKGLHSRWYPQTLKQRILAIHALRGRITFVHGDGMAVIAQHAEHDSAAFFIDPPYTASGKHAGSRLYRHHQLDHTALFALAARLRGNWLFTYDESAEVRALAAQFDFEVEPIVMKSGHHARLTELAIQRRNG